MGEKTPKKYRFAFSQHSECIAELVIFLATSPKSNSVYNSWNKAMSAAKSSGSFTPPKSILNAPTFLMRQLGYSRDYVYDHDTENTFSGQNCFPDKMQREKFYYPKELGFERQMVRRIHYWEKLRAKLQEEKKNSSGKV